MVKITIDQVKELIYLLQGTCMGLEEGCGDLGFSENDLTIEQLLEVDNWIFQCPGCDWWCERSEGCDVDGEDFCRDCYEGMGYEETEDL